MPKIYILSFCFIVVACNEVPQSKKEIKSTSKEESKLKEKKDTTIVYDIAGISSEGAEARVKYVEGKIKESSINIYGETGRANIIYNFTDNRISVTEKKITYKSGIENANSNKEELIESEKNYIIDLNGNVIGKADENRIDIFNEFKKTVPFELKS